MRKVNLIVALGSIFLVFSVAWGITWSKSYERLQQSYHQAPNCSSLSDPASRLSPCTSETVQVVGKKGYGDQRDYEPFATTADLKDTSGLVTRVGIAEPQYELISPGSQLTAQIWRGQICGLRYMGVYYPTGNSPDVLVLESFSYMRLYWVIEGAVLFALILAAYWLKQWKSLHCGTGDIGKSTSRIAHRKMPGYEVIDHVGKWVLHIFMILWASFITLIALYFTLHVLIGRVFIVQAFPGQGPTGALRPLTDADYHMLVLDTALMLVVTALSWSTTRFTTRSKLQL